VTKCRVAVWYMTGGLTLRERGRGVKRKGKAVAGVSPRDSFVILEWGRRGPLISVFFHSGRVWLGPGGRGEAAKNLF